MKPEILISDVARILDMTTQGVRRYDNQLSPRLVGDRKPIKIYDRATVEAFASARAAKRRGGVECPLCRCSLQHIDPVGFRHLFNGSSPWQITDDGPCFAAYDNYTVPLERIVGPASVFADTVQRMNRKGWCRPYIADLLDAMFLLRGSRVSISDLRKEALTPFVPPVCDHQ